MTSGRKRVHAQRRARAPKLNSTSDRPSAIALCALTTPSSGQWGHCSKPWKKVSVHAPLAPIPVQAHSLRRQGRHYVQHERAPTQCDGPPHALTSNANTACAQLSMPSSLSLSCSSRAMHCWMIGSMPPARTPSSAKLEPSLWSVHRESL